MHPKLLFLIIVFCCTLTGMAQKTDSIKIYNPYANAAKDIDSVIGKAKKEKKQVLIQIGGNWCVWCIRLHRFINSNADLKKKMETDYVVYKLNYSSENTNEKLLIQYKHPERFGFPVLLVLDAEGNLLHTQDTGLLEENQGYNKRKTEDFLRNWTRQAVEGK
jgi:thiol:disulfide interchange protein